MKSEQDYLMIKYTIFDLGQVLVKVDFQNFCSEFSKEFNCDLSEHLKEINKGYHSDFMVGKTSGEQFHQLICQYFDHYLSINKFKNIWSTMLDGPLQDTVKILNTMIENNQPVAILSNTDPWHFEQCQRFVPTLNNIKNVFLSYELNLRKPDPEIFIKVAQKLSVMPSQCLLIDDSIENVQAARSVGYDAICFTGINNLISELKKRKISNEPYIY